MKNVKLLAKIRAYVANKCNRDKTLDGYTKILSDGAVEFLRKPEEYTICHASDLFRKAWKDDILFRAYVYGLATMWELSIPYYVGKDFTVKPDLTSTFPHLFTVECTYAIKTRATFCVWLAQNGYLTEKATKFAYKW